MTFEEIYHEFTKKWEGGKVNDPKDPGGATAYGVSFRFLKELPIDMADIDGDGVITWRDVLSMTPAEAERIFYLYFWERPGLFHLHSMVRGVVFDSAVNVGRKRTIKWLQFILHVKPDGVIGPKTAVASMRLNNAPRVIALALLARRRAHYGDLAARREWARKYYQGWINRTAALETLILGQPWVGAKK